MQLGESDEWDETNSYTCTHIFMLLQCPTRFLLYKSAYISLQSLDDSVSSLSGSPDVTLGQLEALRSALTEKEKTVAALNEELSSWQQHRDEYQVEVVSLKDKLNVSEVSI